ncbi:ABC transporter permease [Sporolactobacillus sp. KGMB 08714]|uniref:ABC transporter permease n=1 Tax=Sporolactobacillus sp. KGMB 08714 TaxID=3064704 RepID=UPI002FBEF12E
MRIVYMFITLFLIISITFFLMKLLPGSPYANPEKLTPTQIALLNKQVGLDKPVVEQYFIYLRNLMSGNMGVSFQFNNQPVSALLASRIGPSLQLGIQAIVLGTVVGIILGAVASIRQNTWIDTLCSVIAIIGKSIPNFVFAVVMQYLLAVKLRLFPIAMWDEGIKSTILPTLALAMSPMADAARFIRTEMVEVLHKNFIEFARGKGMTALTVAFKHGLRNSLIPLVTLLGPMAVDLMTGSLVIENIYAVPGIGEQFVKSIMTDDYPTIMAVTILYSAMLIVVILIVDLLYGLIDPRIHIQGSGKR